MNDFENEEQKKAYEEKQGKIHKMVKNECEDILEIKIFKDPVFEEPPKEEDGEKAQVQTHLGNR